MCREIAHPRWSAATLGLCLGLIVPTAKADDAPAQAAAGEALQAIVMDVQGKAKWRPSADGQWRDAKVNDIVDPGAEIRTGLKGSMTLRVGKNATVLVDAGTEFRIPEIVKDGETLRTLATVKSGRVDFKVDKVGFSNDFKVVTPATTLSVRGTGFSLATGPLRGVEVTGVRTNTINAIEVKYVASNASYFMSGSAQTSSERKDPVQSAWVSTVGPPPVVGMLADKGQLSQQVSQGQSGNAPTNSQSSQQVTGATINGRGGNSLIIAAQDPAAPDALKTLAIAVTKRTDVVTPPSGGGGDGGGDDGGDIDNGGSSTLGALLLQELAYVRQKAPVVLTRIAAVNAGSDKIESALAVSELERAQGFDNAFETVYYDGFDLAGVGQLSLDVLQSIRVAGPQDNDIRQAVDGLLREADNPHFVVLGRSGAIRPRIEALDSQVQAEWGHVIFESPAGAQEGGSMLVGRGARDDDAPNAVRWLENAQSWSEQDLAIMSSGALNLQQQERMARLWSIDNGADFGEAKPTVLAIAVNESVQQAWDGVARAVLGPAAGTIHDRLSSGVMSLIDSVGKTDLMDNHTGIDTYVAAYRAAAAAEGTTASAQALAEFESVVAPVRQSLTTSIDRARDAFRQSHEARSLSQRAFRAAEGYAELRQAEEIARRCQDATMGDGGIVPNAFEMQKHYLLTNADAIARGTVRPDLATVRDGTRP